MLRRRTSPLGTSLRKTRARGKKWGRVAAFGLLGASSFAMFGGAAACASMKGDPPPTAVLASTPEAGIFFARVRDALLAGRAHADAGQARGELRAMLEQFLAQNPRDPLVPVAR